MPFDAAGFDGRDRPTSDRDPWGTVSLFLHKLVLFLLKAAFFGIMLIFVAHVVAVATGNGCHVAANREICAVRDDHCT